MCEEACPSVSALASTQFLPVISYGCSSAVLADTSKYPTFSRTCPSIADVHLMMEQLLLYFRWTKVALISISGSAFANTADQIEVSGTVTQYVTELTSERFSHLVRDLPWTFPSDCLP